MIFRGPPQVAIARYAVTLHHPRYAVTTTQGDTIGQTTAERQRAYRQRHLKEGLAERLNMTVSVSAKRQLERLARHHGTTQRAVLELLLAEAEAIVADDLPTKEQSAYYEGVTR